MERLVQKDRRARLLGDVVEAIKIVVGWFEGLRVVW